MKKIVALLLSLVIMVPVLGISVYAENNNCEEVKYSLFRMVSEKTLVLKDLLVKLGVLTIENESEKPADNTALPKEDKAESMPNTEVTEDNKNTSTKNDTQDNGTISDFEKEVADLVNAERVKYGLQPLTLNSELSDGARLKSKDMHDNKYFSHTSPTYGSPFDMMKSLGITYQTAGENIAMGYHSPEAVVNAWMNSEGHRANILNASFTEIGVGYIADGGYFTQWFRG